MFQKNFLRKQAAAPSGTMPPRDPNKVLGELIETIRQLKSIYERETEALENIDTEGFLAVQDEKLSAAQQYQAGIQTIIAHKNEMKNADAVLKNELTRMQEQFTELSYKNMDALKRMQRTMDRLGQTIRNAAKNEAKKMQALSYSRRGTMNSSDKARISIGVSETA